MTRTRRLALTLALLAVLASACGRAGPNGQVIGIRTLPSTRSEATFELDLASMRAAMSDQLADANATQGIPGEEQLAAGELPLDTILTIRQIERLAVIQQLGEAIIQNRLDAIAGLRGQVLGYRSMTSADKWNLAGLLDNAAARLRAMRVTIARDLSVDQARADVTAVGQFRVYGLLIPKIHMLIATYTLRQQLPRLTSVEQSLELQLNIAVPTANVAGARTALNDMLAQISIVDQQSSTALSLLRYLDPSGYPNNRGYLRVAGSYLDRGQAAAWQAGQDAKTVRADLHL